MDTAQARGQFQLAVRLCEELKFRESLEVLDLLDGRYPDRLKVTFHKSVCLAGLNRLDEAESLLESLRGTYDRESLKKLAKWCHSHRMIQKVLSA